MKTPNWASNTSEYCQAVAPYATPLLEVCKDLFASVGETRRRLQMKEVENTDITTV